MRWEQLAEEDQRLIQDMALEAAKVSAGGELHGTRLMKQMLHQKID